MRSWRRWPVRLDLGLIAALMTAWCAGALYYSGPGGERTRITLAIAFALATVVAFLLLPRRGRTLIGFLVVSGVVIVWWILIPAPNERNWQAEVAVTPWVSQEGD